MDREALKLRGPSHGGTLGFADMAMHASLDGVDEGGHFSGPTLDLDPHPAIVEIGDVTGDLEFLRDLAGGIAEAHSLDIA